MYGYDMLRRRRVGLGLSAVAAVVALLMGVDVAATTPVVGQAVAAEAAAEAEIDRLEARAENFAETVPDGQVAAATADLTASTWEPTPGPSEAPEEFLPEADLPAVGDPPEAEGSTEPVEEVPADPTDPAGESSARSLAAAGGDSSGSPGDAAGLEVLDLTANPQRLEVDDVALTVASDEQAEGAISVSVERVTPDGSPALLVRIQPVLERAKIDKSVKAGAPDGGVSVNEESDLGVVDVEVDYDEFADTLASTDQIPGGDWESRLTLVEVPSCATWSADCTEQSRVSNVTSDAAAQTLAASVDLSAGTAVTMMLSAGSSGGAGDWGATSLAPAASWGAGGNTGAFSWTYPLSMPQVTGPGPQLDLSYSSAASDGRVASTNNQSGVVGEGWSLTESYIERRFVPCADDQDPVDGKTANNVGHTTGDMCVGEDNATMVLNGAAVDLVKTASGWVPKKVDGTRVERKTGASNGDAEGEYWVVTATDGTIYTFGRGKRTSDGLATGSSWTMPVYGNHEGEAGHKTSAQGGFAASASDQTYRWMLEHVQEPTGGTMTYVYSKETRKYTPNLDDDVVAYTAGGYLSRILYGTRAGAESGSAPVRVDLEYATRCVPGTGVNCDAGRVKQNLSAWPDVPGDLVCYKSANSCGIDAISPSFYTLYRLDRVVTRVLDGSTYKPVDSWKLNQSFVAPGDGSLGDGSGKVMWLASIRHTGHGGTVTTDDDLSNNAVKFAREMLANRVDRDGDGLPPMYRPRMTGIRTESGALITPTYRTECSAGTSPVSSEATDAVLSGNEKLCFPVDWQDDSRPMDWFHKYVVAAVVQNGASTTGAGEVVTGSGQLVTRYEYVGDAKWVKPSGPLTKKKEVTWSEFRGYRTVVTTEGKGSQASSTTTRYLRGLGSGGDFQVGPAGDRITVKDHDAHAGTVVETIVHDGETEDQAVSWSVTSPQAPVVVATGADGTKVTRQAGTTAYGFELDAAGLVAIRTQSATWTDAAGQVVRAEDLGDVSSTTDDTCTQITYAHDDVSTLADRNMIALAGRTQTFAATCAKVTGGQVSRPLDVVSDQVTTYDSVGQPTSVQGLDPDLDRETATVGNGSGAGYVTTQRMTYDAYGRVTGVTDVAGKVTTTSYSPASAVIPATVTTTTPDPDGSGPKPAFSSSVTFDKVTGLMTASTDANGQSTRGTYDALGRLRTVTYPEHAGLGKPSIAYEYTTRANGLNVVLTRTLGADSDDKPVQHVSAEFHDGLMRVFQTQDEVVDTGERRQDDAATRGRLVTQVFYDTAGRVWKETTAQPATGVVSNQPVQPTLVAPSATVYAYDGAGRVTDQIFYTGVEDDHTKEQSRTVTRYDAPYTTVVPPDGGTATTTVTDGRGRTTALWEHKNRPTVSSDRADGHWYVSSTLPGFQPENLATNAYQATTYEFDRLGQLASMSDPGGNAWTYGYDLGGRQVRASDPDAGVTTTRYTSTGQVERTVNGNANATGASTAVREANTLVYSYDALGRPMQVADGAGSVRSTWTYDTTPGPGNKAALGLPSSSTRYQDGEPYTTRIDAYDAAYRATSTTMVLPDDLPGLEGLVERQFTTTYDYRIDGSVRQQVLPGATATDDDAATPDVAVLGSEHVTTFYDDAGLPVWMGGGFGWGTYVADSQFTAEGRPLAMDLGNTYGAVVTYDWDYPTGRLDGIRLDRERFDGRDVNMTYSYDAAGNVTRIRDTPNVGEPASGDSENDDTQCFDLDGLGRLVGAWTQLEATCVSSIDEVDTGDVGGSDASAAPYWQRYTYDQLGNRTSLSAHTITAAAATDDVVRTTYRHAQGAAGPHQVTSVSRQVGPEATVSTAPSVEVASYTYDAAGNQTTRQSSEPVDAADTAQVEADSDGDGLLEAAQLLGWDGEGELATVATTGEGTQGENTIEDGEASFVYSAAGERITRTDATGITVYLPGGQEVHVDQAGAVGVVRYYSFAGQTVAVRTGRGLGGVTSLVCDRQGTPVAAVPNTVWTEDSVTRLYSDPFGADRTPSRTDTDSGETLTGADRLPGDRRFLAGAGGVEDTGTGLVLLGARYYDPGLGRFVSVDPQLDAGTPAQFNAYVYSGNDPVTYSDPSGESWLSNAWNATKSGVSKAAGAVTSFVKDNQAAIVGSVVGGLAFAGCMAVTAGAGSVGCAVAAGAVGGAVSNLWRTKVEKKEPFTWKGFAVETGIGAATGLASAGVSAVVSRFGPSAAAAAANAIRSVSSAVTQRVSSSVSSTVARVAQSRAVAAAKATQQRVAGAVTNLRLNGGRCSFAGVTGVLMADGTAKAIDEVQPGDLVIAADPDTGERHAKKVQAVHGHDDVMITLVLTTAAGERREIVTTEDHPFWSQSDREFERADQLGAGEMVATGDGGTMKVQAVQTREVRFEPAYNLTVEGLHTYHVVSTATTLDTHPTRGPPAIASDAILVHNCPTRNTGANAAAAISDAGSDIVGTAHNALRPSQDWIEKDVVDNYVLRLRAGDKLPSIEVERMKDGTEVILDGHHRYVASRISGIPVEKSYVQYGFDVGEPNWLGVSYGN
ncbi:RHS repeat-associated protein [Isoptericola jiangsuensis]|uniref:RHS repeat-associated protein n=1 Tax=Isoptericola jiangsuensis TaxID=548579 RepID=A0A2A9EXU6_9MICO|nr:RHS repeat-associated core domain-containing protein [Isoptericola jiangsuensis]PFG43376.1 RHS repeat-associated protein [Isoptericola jiangsuensis]